MLIRCLALLFCCSLQAKPQLIWLHTDWPPHQIVSGPFQGQGTFDLLQQQLKAAMPQFDHQQRLVSLARLEQMFQQQDETVCTIGTLYSAERAQTRLFSAPIAVGAALAVGYLPGKLTLHPSMQKEGANIAELAQDKSLVGAYQANRLYPAQMQQLLQQGDSNLSSQAFTSEVNAAALLGSNRVDYVIEYPERMQYYSHLLVQPVVLEYRAIAGANVASVTHVACTFGEVGEAAIAAVNQALPTLWQSPAYLEAMHRWHDDSSRQRLQPDVAAQQAALMQLQPRADNAVDARD